MVLGLRRIPILSSGPSHALPLATMPMNRPPDDHVNDLDVWGPASSCVVVATPSTWPNRPTGNRRPARLGHDGALVRIQTDSGSPHRVRPRRQPRGRSMSGVEASWRSSPAWSWAAPSMASCCRSSSMPRSTDCAGMGDELVTMRASAGPMSTAAGSARLRRWLVLVVLLVLDVVPAGRSPGHPPAPPGRDPRAPRPSRPRQYGGA